MKNIGGSKSGMSKEMMNVIILTVVVWYTTQIAASLMMKKVMKRTIISPIDMTLSNLAISCSLDYIYVRFLAGSRLPTMSKSFSVKILPIAASLLLVKALTLMGYEYITISLAHTIKSCEPVFTVAFSIVGYKVRFSQSVYISLIPMVGGAVMAASSDVEFHLIGVLAIVGATVFQSLQRLFNKALLGTISETKTSHDLSRILGIKFCIALQAMIMCVPLALLSRLATSGGNVTMKEPSSLIENIIECAPSVIVSSAFQWLAGAASYYLLALIAPLSHSVAKITERMLLILISVVLFQNHSLSFINITGILLALFGVLCYLYVKNRDQSYLSSRNSSSSNGNNNSLKPECKGVGVVEMSNMTTKKNNSHYKLSHV